MSLIARLGLDAELARWRAAGRTPVLWWRDDDACAVTPALERLLSVAGGLPLALAVVPQGDGLAGLAARLRTAPAVSVGQHGCDHLNRRAPGAPAGEHAPDATAGEIASAVAAGRRRLAEAGIEPAFYCPPWNRVDAALPAALGVAGFARLSAWRAPTGLADGLLRVDADLDLLRWKGRPRFRGAWRVYAELRQELAARRRAGRWSAPVGLLTHHLDHDAAAWDFLEIFLPWSRGRFVWRRFEELAGAFDGLVARRAA